MRTTRNLRVPCLPSLRPSEPSQPWPSSSLAVVRLPSGLFQLSRSRQFQACGLADLNSLTSSPPYGLVLPSHFRVLSHDPRRAGEPAADVLTHPMKPSSWPLSPVPSFRSIHSFILQLLHRRQSRPCKRGVYPYVIQRRPPRDFSFADTSTRSSPHTFSRSRARTVWSVSLTEDSCTGGVITSTAVRDAIVDPHHHDVTSGSAHGPQQPAQTANSRSEVCRCHLPPHRHSHRSKGNWLFIPSPLLSACLESTQSTSPTFLEPSSQPRHGLSLTCIAKHSVH